MRDTLSSATTNDDAALLDQARLGPEDSPFDYIIVGSGAGGGPLAARLALAGKRVLVIEAGGDPAQQQSRTYPEAEPGEVYACPGYHGASTEDCEMSWQFSVRHYAGTARQQQDEKYNQNDPAERYRDPASTGGTSQGGIFYPRSSGIGGCTGHHAMIVAVPNDRDWNYIADLTGDESWRPDKMHGYFTRLERCLYTGEYKRWFQRLLGPIYFIWQWLALLFDPRAVLDEGGHGTRGWQPTSFIDPQLIEGIQRSDRGFTSVLIGSALAVLHSDNQLVAWLKRSLVWLRVVQHIDPNDLNTRRTSPEGVFLIPTGIESGGAVDENGMALRGRRVGVREFLLRTRAEHPERLVLKTRTHVTRVLFEQPAGSGVAPKAIGIEAAEGDWLYEASPLRQSPPATRVRYFTRGEVILCGGAFNTPQLLMLSGIGDRETLEHVLTGADQTATCALHDAHGRPLRSGGALRRIDLPGVGRNLQDRYEVSVVSELETEFATLQNVSFAPGDANDPVRQEWLETGGGLYRTNGGTLAVLRRSRALGPTDPEPDLFAFGVPAAFRGYYWGYSRELLRRTLGAPTEQRNLWSWVILKAYTRNHDGRVALRSADPFAQPEICFDSFNERAEVEARTIAADIAQLTQAGQPIPAALAQRAADNAKVRADSERDLDALVDAVAFMRAVNARNPKTFVHEVQPGAALVDGSDALKEWIRTQAWGHHASCTSRMGSDRWRADPANLRDRGAVLDSRFRVHGVTGLRVVDASVFPAIPGYFILTPILMISEKAADVLLEDSGDSVYPARFRNTETAAVLARREAAHHVMQMPDPERAAASNAAVATAAASPPAGSAPNTPGLPPHTVGLALSGGGIRSATFALGVLQRLAEIDRLRDVDFLSTVSGGGFIGSFLGRLFTREMITTSADPVGRVQDTLVDTRSGPMWWLRTQANYIFAIGSADLRQGLAVFWRNIFSVHLVIGALLFALFGLLAWASRSLGLPPAPVPPPMAPGGPLASLMLSPWWWTPLAALAVSVLPATAAFWLSPRPGSYRSYPVFALFAWLALVVGALWMLQIPNGVRYTSAALCVLVLSWLWQDVARWGNAPQRELRAARQRFARAGRRDGNSHAAELRQQAAEARQQVGTIVRNRLTRALGDMVVLFAVLVVFVILDSLALSAAVRFDRSATMLTALLIALGPLLPVLRGVGMGALRQLSAARQESLSLVRIAKLASIPLALFLLFVIDVITHHLFRAEPTTAGWLVGLALVFSLVIGRAFDFLNLSTLRATYAARLSRTFLGASNAARVCGAPADETPDVQTAHPKDDLAYDQYHPEVYGAPIHLINVCINETVDVASEREVRERKGISMCVSPHGVAVGRRYFAEWAPPDPLPLWQKWRRWRDGLDADDNQPAERRRRTALRAIPFPNDPNAFHVLKSKRSASAEVEPLSLASWTAISGAAFSTGTGRSTTLPLSLFMGLTNIRLGYWWDSGILPHERPGRYPPPLWRKLKRLPFQLFRMQSLLLAEWSGRFRGPSEWFWQLSDGGHFDVTGLYELLRRRVPFVIVADAGEDPEYRFGDLAQLTRQVRQDLRAEITWIGNLPPHLPTWINQWIDPTALAPIEELGRASARHAAMAHVTYVGTKDETWILLIKPGVDPTLTQDVGNYAADHEAFPQESTFDQVFDDNQWESYRALGQQIGRRVLRGRS